MRFKHTSQDGTLRDVVLHEDNAPGCLWCPASQKIAYALSEGRCVIGHSQKGVRSESPGHLLGVTPQKWPKRPEQARYSRQRTGVSAAVGRDAIRRFLAYANR